MKGVGISVPPLHAGVRFDLEALLTAFKAKNSVRFEAFGEVFADLKMSLIFAGRQTAAELIEFEEHLLQLSAAYMMSIKSGEISGYPERIDPDDKPEIPTYSRSERPLEMLPVGVMGVPKVDEHEEGNKYVMTLVERMFGIYCCYAFYYLQPKDHMAQIRISAAQLRDITDFVEDRLRTERHLDAMACLYKLINEGAFRITAFELMYDPACHKRYEAEDEDECCMPPGTEAPLERMKELIEDNTMQQLEFLHNNYERAKKEAGFKGVTHGEIDVSASAQRILEKAKMAIRMEEMRPMIEMGREGPHASGDAAGGDNSSRLDIKKRAYSSGVTASRHRRYAFADGEDTVAINEEEMEEEAPGPSKNTAKKRARPSRKSQREEKADELIQELQELGVPGVVKRKATSPRKSISISVENNPEAILADSFGETTKEKRIRKNEALKAEAPVLRLLKSKKEEDADREMAKLMKMMRKEKEEII